MDVDMRKEWKQASSEAIPVLLLCSAVQESLLYPSSLYSPTVLHPLPACNTVTRHRYGGGSRRFLWGSDVG